MKRNTVFGGLSMLAAGAVIGAGAMISSSAMATSSTAVPTDQLTMVQMDPDGSMVKCTFEGVAADGLLPDGVELAPGGNPPAEVVVGWGSLELPEGADELPTEVDELPIEVEGQLPEGVTMVEAATAAADELAATGTVAVVGSTARAPEDGTLVAPISDAREGTEEECAAIHEEAVSMASAASRASSASLVTTATDSGLFVESGSVDLP